MYVACLSPLVFPLTHDAPHTPVASFLAPGPAVFQVILRRLLSPGIEMKGTEIANDDAEADATAATTIEGPDPSSKCNADSPPEETSEMGRETSPSPAAVATAEAVRQE